MFKKLLLVAGVVAVASSASANLTFKAGVGYLDPTAKKDINADTIKAEVSGEAAILPSFDYRFGGTPFSAEVLLASPFEHSVKSDNEEIAKFKHLPPTVTFNSTVAPSSRLLLFIPFSASWNIWQMAKRPIKRGKS